jgi:hypothetical protein
MHEPDGGLVEVEVEGGWQPVMPDPPYPSMLGEPDCVNSGMSANPLDGLPGWAMKQMEWQQIRVPLDTYVGKVVRIGFHVGYDCNNCDPLTAGWFIDDVVVASP